MDAYLLTTRGLTKVYSGQKVVNSVDVHIKKGAIYGMIGRNGAGKTTFMKMICGLSAPANGEIALFGYTGSELKKIRSRIGCLIEAPGLYPDMNAYENLKLKCIFNGMNKKSYMDELLEIVGLKDAGKKSVQHFSLGMKQRLGIAIALAGEPDLLVLDEPVNGLDPQGIIEIREMLQILNRERNITIIISSHILEELSKIATDYGIIHNGVLLEELTAKELNRRCRERIEITLEKPQNAVPVLEGFGITDYRVTDKEHIHIFERINDSPVINKELIMAGIAVSEIKIKSAELEQYFLELTGGSRDA